MHMCQATPSGQMCRSLNLLHESVISILLLETMYGALGERMYVLAGSGWREYTFSWVQFCPHQHCNDFLMFCLEFDGVDWPGSASMRGISYLIL